MPVETVPSDESVESVPMGAEAGPAEYAGEPTYGGVGSEQADATAEVLPEGPRRGGSTDPMDEIYAASDESEGDSERP